MTMSGDLVLANVSKRLGDSHILRDVSAVVPAGKTTALVGPNGTGKTTLLNIISGLLQPDRGEVTLAGRSIAGLEPYLIARRGIGRLFQDVRIFAGLSTLENVMAATVPVTAHRSWYGWRGRKQTNKLMRQVARDALQWLHFVGLADNCDSSAGSLSVGQQKLLGLARLLAQRPSLLLLDEPTAGLAPSAIDKVTSLIARAVSDHNVTVLLVEHNMNVVLKLSSHVHFLHEGHVSYSGDPEAVLSSREVLELYTGLR